MEHYNLRTTSLNDAQLTTELTKRGAQTFGTVRRKQQRLQRFIDAETNREEARETLRVVIENNQRRIYGGVRAHGRIARLLEQYLGY
jgi:hypothetical protein